MPKQHNTAVVHLANGCQVAVCISDLPTYDARPTHYFDLEARQMMVRIGSYEQPRFSTRADNVEYVTTEYRECNDFTLPVAS